MNLKWSILSLLVLAFIACIVYFYLPEHPGRIPEYDREIFYPIQLFRGRLLGNLPFSIGDMFYICLGICLLVVLVKWVAYLFRFRQDNQLLAASIIRTIKAILWLYLLFIIGWGANYYKPSLREYWSLTPLQNDKKKKSDVVEGKKKALADLITYDQFLVNKLNTFAPHYHALSLPEIDKEAKEYFKTYTNCKVKQDGLHIKPSMFSYFMEWLAIEGYYNPFTGEGQVNAKLPAFIMPFLVCHEMAHQAGIGSEEDANLMAYALCTTAADSTFHYSSYLNIWLYVNNRLYRRDSALALKYESMLNKLTTAHIDTLEQINRKYQNQYAKYSTQLYDDYLKMQDQKEGIRSYGNVASSAWLLEQRRIIKTDSLIRIP